MTSSRRSAAGELGLCLLRDVVTCYGDRKMVKTVLKTETMSITRVTSAVVMTAQMTMIIF